MDKDKIMDIAAKIRNRGGRLGLNEEQTKTSFIMPFFIALGYDVFDIDEFIPEYTADFGVKQGEKVDYAICINGQPVVLIECKKIGASLSNEHVSQLFRYYASTDAKIGILTNGDEYWFFADSIKRNQMDRDPYLRIRLSEIGEWELRSLECYTRDNIDRLDILEDVQSQRFRLNLREFIGKIDNGNIPSDFIEYLSSKFNTENLPRTKAAAIFNEIYSEIVKCKEKEGELKEEHLEIVNDKQGKSKKDRSKAVELPIGEPIGLDVGSLAFHTPQSIVIYKKSYSIRSIWEILYYTIIYIIDEKFNGEKERFIEFYREIKLRSPKFPIYKDSDVDIQSIRGAKSLKDFGYILGTAFGADTIVDYTLRIMNIANINKEDLKIILSK